jgi:hypothetical protein
MIRGVPRLAALAVAAAASATLMWGVALADEPVNRGGAPGKPGSATSYCRTSVPPQDDASQVLCKTTPGRPGEPGPAVDY